MLIVSLVLSRQHRAAGAGAARAGAHRRLLSSGGLRAVQQRGSAEAAEEAQPEHPGRPAAHAAAQAQAGRLQRHAGADRTLQHGLHGQSRQVRT